MIRSEVEALRGRGIERFGVNLIPAATAASIKTGISRILRMRQDVIIRKIPRAGRGA
jgi:hypothetical protein